MDLSSYTAALREDLHSAAALGDEQTQRTAAALASSVEPAVRLILMSALSELAAEVTAALGDRVVEVRLDGRDVRVVVGGEHSPQEPTRTRTRTTTFDDVSGDISRVTVRMVDQLKAKAERAANQDGVSLNSWLSQAVHSALREPGPPPTGSSRTLRGWVQG